MTRLVAALLIFGLAISGSVMANDDIDAIETRQELMERTKDAAKRIGGMLKEQEPFDAASAMMALETWKKTAVEAGELFPVGSETGHDTEAKSTIWSDREGFDQKLSEFRSAVDHAIDANPATLAQLKVAAGPVFKTCKNCHEGYRVEKDD